MRPPTRQVPKGKYPLILPKEFRPTFMPRRLKDNEQCLFPTDTFRTNVLKVSDSANATKEGQGLLP